MFILCLLVFEIVSKKYMEAAETEIATGDKIELRVQVHCLLNKHYRGMQKY